MKHFRATTKRVPARAGECDCWEKCFAFWSKFIGEPDADAKCCDKYPDSCGG
jgi:hypothetical protein